MTTERNIPDFAAVEVDPEDHLMDIIWAEDEPPETVPMYPEGERRCASCGCVIGWALRSWEDGYGREREGVTWHTCYRHPDGRERCEDCS